MFFIICLRRGLSNKKCSSHEGEVGKKETAGSHMKKRREEDEEGNFNFEKRDDSDLEHDVYTLPIRSNTKTKQKRTNKTKQ